MAKRRAKAAPADDMQANNNIVVEQSPDETGAQAMARKLLKPSLKNAAAASGFTNKMIGDIAPPGITDYAVHLQNMGEKAAAGEVVGTASDILMAQAIALDSMFAELARRSAMNMGEYFDAAERYGRLALKAQTNCRTTLEALAKLHQPREQTVRHVHVNEGGKAVVADHFHNYTGPSANVETGDQSHATGNSGERPALLGQDPQGVVVPIASGERPEKVPDARRHKSGRA